MQCPVGDVDVGNRRESKIPTGVHWWLEYEGPYIVRRLGNSRDGSHTFLRVPHPKLPCQRADCPDHLATKVGFVKASSIYFIQ
jgi:hypothetical protein